MIFRDEFVETWFDTGGGRQHGPRLLYGQVIKSGPRTATIVWESGLRNRVYQGSNAVKHARDIEEAYKAMSKVQS